MDFSIFCFFFLLFFFCLLYVQLCLYLLPTKLNILWHRFRFGARDFVVHRSMNVSLSSSSPVTIDCYLQYILKEEANNHLPCTHYSIYYILEMWFSMYTSERSTMISKGFAYATYIFIIGGRNAVERRKQMWTFCLCSCVLSILSWSGCKSKNCWWD